MQLRTRTHAVQWHRHIEQMNNNNKTLPRTQHDCGNWSCAWWPIAVAIDVDVVGDLCSMFMFMADDGHKMCVFAIFYCSIYWIAAIDRIVQENNFNDLYVRHLMSKRKKKTIIIIAQLIIEHNQSRRRNNNNDNQQKKQRAAVISSLIVVFVYI